MERLGEYLKRERQLRGLSVEELAAQLKLSKKTILSLEADDYEYLPHPIYVKGFIRSYCRCMGIDENDAVLRYEIALKELSGEEDAAAVEKTRKKKEEEGYKGFAGLLSRYSVVAAIIVVSAAVVLYLAVFGIRGKYEELAVEKPSAEEAEVKPVEAIKPKETVKEIKEVKKEEPKKPEPMILPSKPKLILDIYAKKETWIKAEIDKKETKEALLKEGERIKWSADEVFF